MRLCGIRETVPSDSKSWGDLPRPWAATLLGSATKGLVAVARAKRYSRLMTETELVEIRRRAIRRSRYGMNAVAMFDPKVPAEGPFDAALTNGLLVIVAEEAPGQDFDESGRARAASALLKIVRRCSIEVPAVELLREGLTLTQAFRHGRADEEWITIDGRHVQAVMNLDEHWALNVLDTARDALNVDDCLYRMFVEEAERQLPFDPKDRSDVPEPDFCDQCHRPTFLAAGWDMFGGTDSPGFCVACGYIRSEAEADELARSNAFHAAVEDPRR